MTIVFVVWLAPCESCASSVTRARSVRVRREQHTRFRGQVERHGLHVAAGDGERARGEREHGALCLAACRIAGDMALSVRSVTVPEQLLSPAGQLILSVTTPDALTCSEVLASWASGTGGATLL